MKFDEEIDKLETRFRLFQGNVEDDIIETIQEVFMETIRAIQNWKRLEPGQEKDEIAEEIEEKIRWLKNNP